MMNNTPKLLSNKEQKLFNDKLFQLIVTGDVQAIIKCIQQGADIYAQNRYGDTALKMAIQYLSKDDMQVIFNFVKQNKAPKTEKHTINTQQTSNTEPIKQQPVVTNNNTSKSLSKNEQKKLNQQLFHATLSGNIQAVESCIQKGADVNAIHESGYTPLMSACTCGNIDIVNLLIDKGADVNAKDYEGHTAYNYLFNYIQERDISLKDMPTFKEVLNLLKETHSVKHNNKHLFKTLKDEFSH